MIELSKELVIIEYGIGGIIAGIFIGAIRTKAPDSTAIKYISIVAFITPFAYVVTSHLQFGISMLIGVAIGTVMVYATSDILYNDRDTPNDNSG